MGMVERVARAMDAAGLQYIIAYEAKAKDDPTMIPWIGMADVPMTVLSRAAIEAMRDPDDEMVRRADGLTDLVGPYPEANTPESRQDEFRCAWRAMIDKALESVE